MAVVAQYLHWHLSIFLLNSLRVHIHEINLATCPNGRSELSGAVPIGLKDYAYDCYFLVLCTAKEYIFGTDLEDALPSLPKNILQLTNSGLQTMLHVRILASIGPAKSQRIRIW